MNVTTVTTSPTITELAARLDKAESRYHRAEKRLRVLCGALFGAITLAVSLPFVSPAVAQGYGMTLAQAATRIAALETKTASISVLTAPNTNQPTVRFSGVNVQIVDGTGATEGTQSGLGNLVIGYNELRGSGDTRTGNHNLVAGIRNNYSGNGGVVFGFQNSISNVEATVTGGSGNTASGPASSVSGGSNNTASGSVSSVSGGSNNTANDFYSSVSGGNFNVANNQFASVSGGAGNTASGSGSSVAGGNGNTASALYSSVSGGRNNTAPYRSSSVSGGDSLTPLQSGQSGGVNAPWCAGGGPGGSGVYKAPN